jgi:hypothetical protein
MNRKYLIISLVVGLLSTVSPADLYLQGVGADHELNATNDRFYTGAGADFIGQGYDWSGVGENQCGQWATMISPSYFISANHYHPGPGDTLTFHLDNDPNGPTYTTGIASGILIPGTVDLYLGKLTSPIPASEDIATYPIWVLPNLSAYANQNMFVYGTPNKVGQNVISYASASQVYYTFSATGGDGPNEAYLMSGDSGAPSFGYSNGQLAVLGVHWTNSGSTPYDGATCSDTNVSNYVAALQANMVGETLRVSSLESCTWSASGGNWCTKSCWSPATLPGATDTAIVNLSASLTSINVDSASSVGSVYMNGAGALSVTGNLLTVASAVSVGAGQTIQGSGRIAAPAFNVNGGTLGGALSLTGNVVSTGGHFTPGGATKMSVTGNLTLDPASVVNFQLGAPGSMNDQINIVGNLTLDGTLNVSALTGFGPAAGSASATYPLFNYTGVLTDNNPQIVMPPKLLNPVSGYNYTYSGTLVTTANQVDLVVTLNGDANGDGVLNSADIDALYKQYGTGAAGQAVVSAELKNMFNTGMGDANLDHCIDLLDFQTLLSNWQKSGPGLGWAQGDFNGDGTVNFSDFQLMLNDWNPVGFTPVPEPASLSLILLGGLALLRRKKWAVGSRQERQRNGNSEEAKKEEPAAVRRPCGFFLFAGSPPI